MLSKKMYSKSIFLKNINLYQSLIFKVILYDCQSFKYFAHIVLAHKTCRSIKMFFNKIPWYKLFFKNINLYRRYIFSVLLYNKFWKIGNLLPPCIIQQLFEYIFILLRIGSSIEPFVGRQALFNIYHILIMLLKNNL